MENENNSSIKIMVSILEISILVVAVIGISFAAFAYIGTGTVENKITTGILRLEYQQPQAGITLTDAMPMTDDSGKILDGNDNVFDFSIESEIKGTATINYVITAKTEPALTLKDEHVKVYLTNRDTGSDTTDDSFGEDAKVVNNLSKTTGQEDSQPEEGEYILKSGTISEDKTTKYRLRMWVAESFPGVSEAETYKLKVNVYGAAKAQ